MVLWRIGRSYSPFYIIMLKTCSRCGIVKDNHICPYKPKKKNHQTTAQDIRRSYKWTQKSLSIRQRDDFLCRVCRLELYDTRIKYNSKDLSVHHIIPINDNPDRAFDDDNLITLCEYHHELAESLKIPQSELLKIVKDDLK